MLLLTLLKNSFAALVGGAVFYVLFLMLRVRAAERAFKKKSTIPWLPGGNPILGHVGKTLYSSRNWMVVAENHRKYGKTVAGLHNHKPIVSTLDLELIKKFVIDEPNDHLDRFQPNFPIREIAIDGMLFMETKQWRRVRKAVAPAFTWHKLKSPNVQSEIHHCIDRVVSSLELKLDEAKKIGEKSVEINAEDLFSRYTLDLIFTCFFKQPNIIDYNVEKEFWSEATNTFARDIISPMFRFCIAFPVLNPIINWLLFNFHSSGVYRSNLYKMVLKHIEANKTASKESKASGENDFEKVDSFVMKDGSKFKRSLIDYVMDNYLNGFLTRREYIHTTMTLMFGSNKSSTDALSKLLFNLSTHQQVQTKLRNLVAKEGDDCKYLDMVVHESLRLFPPVYAGCSRTITRDIESECGLVPKGSFVVTPVYLIHKLKEYWGEDAEEFRPERWENAKNFHPVQHLTFGAGKRNCVGMQFALVEIKMFIRQLILRYRFDPSPKTDPTMMHEAPAMMITIPDTPVHVKISRLH